MIYKILIEIFCLIDNIPHKSDADSRLGLLDLSLYENVMENKNVIINLRLRPNHGENTCCKCFDVS